jgi:hypothetical protein
MNEKQIQRQGVDRRRQPRGGRREDDIDGFAPLVFVVGGAVQAREACETILAKLRFAVAMFPSPDAALNAIDSLRPELLVVGPEVDRQQVFKFIPATYQLPIVLLPDTTAPDTIVESVRQALRHSVT